jgi:hypothetical protein
MGATAVNDLDRAKDWYRRGGKDALTRVLLGFDNPLSRRTPGRMT